MSLTKTDTDIPISFPPTWATAEPTSNFRVLLADLIPQVEKYNKTASMSKRQRAAMNQYLVAAKVTSAALEALYVALEAIDDV